MAHGRAEIHAACNSCRIHRQSRTKEKVAQKNLHGSAGPLTEETATASQQISNQIWNHVELLAGGTIGRTRRRRTCAVHPRRGGIRRSPHIPRLWPRLG